MKKYLLYAAITCTVFAACSNEGSKLEGSWVNLPNARLDKPMKDWFIKMKQIDKEHIDFIFAVNTDHTVHLEYNKDTKKYMGFIGGANCTVEYLADKDRVLIVDPQNRGDLFPMELKHPSADTLATWEKEIATYQ